MTEIEAERERLMGELFKVGFRLGMPTEAYQTARNEAIAAIRRKLDALPPKPYGPTGAQWGTVWIGRPLGSLPARPQPPTAEPHGHVVDYNPIEYWAKEFGWSTDE
jgi:hypothetical protein